MSLQPSFNVIAVHSYGFYTYIINHSDIENFAKAWTGFVYTPARGNIEDRTAAAENKLDPMTIVPTYRDAFPKTNLKGG